MRQVIQNFRSGATEVVDAPAPGPKAGHVVVQNHASLVSAGTERMLVEFGRAGLIDKARQQPEKVAMVLDKARADGIIATLEAVTAKLDQPIPLGYSSTGTVVGLGSGVEGIQLGDRVASNGPHAEIVRVPARLCAVVPRQVSDETAAFTVVGAIALQAVRLMAPEIGETVVVTGLGLVGLLAVQILVANGCRVIGVDIDVTRTDLARAMGAAVVDASRDDPVNAATALTAGRGVDGVLIAASTQSNQPVAHAARMCRQRGRIVLVGVAGLELSRADFYAKELTFQVSCSYGPGRYDAQYEEHGHDYPLGFVRWTEERNLGAVLQLMAAGSIRTDQLVSHRIPIERASEAYEILLHGRGSLGILVTYADTGSSNVHARTIVVARADSPPAEGVVCGMVGAGNHASRMLLPAFKKAGAAMRTMVTTGSVQAVHLARKFGFVNVSTDVESILNDTLTSTIVIATRHDTHAELVVRALAAGKHVFVEKPLALTLVELERIREQLNKCGATRPVLAVGFNRRFSPLARRMHDLVARAQTRRAFIYTVNAGQLPPDHWARDKDVGGGRILGEVCHFIDFLRFLAGARIVTFDTQVLGGRTSSPADDSITVTLSFANGDIGTVHYFTHGGRAFPKERVEVFAAGGVLRLDNFRRLDSIGWPAFSGKRLWAQNKGQNELVAAFLSAVETGGDEPIAVDELFEVADVTIRCARFAEQHGDGR